MFYNCFENLCKSIYIMIGLEETNTAVYRYSIKPKRTFGI
jgi:hypothetical protein